MMGLIVALVWMPELNNNGKELCNSKTGIISHVNGKENRVTTSVNNVGYESP